MDKHFGGVIWTNHALERLTERGIKQGDAWATWRNPEQSRKGSTGNWVYYKTYGNVKIEVVAKQNENGEWLILSVWSRPAGSAYGTSGSYGNQKYTIWQALKQIFTKKNKRGI